MTKTDFQQLLDKTFQHIRQLTASKGEEYSHSDDQLANFKRYAVDTGIPVIAVWSVLFGKHMDSIKSYVHDAQKVPIYAGSEPIEGRIDDTILYLCLLKAIVPDVASAMDIIAAANIPLPAVTSLAITDVREHEGAIIGLNLCNALGCWCRRET